MRYRRIEKNDEWCIALYKGDADRDLVLTMLVPQIGSYEIATRLTEDEALIVTHYDRDSEYLVDLSKRIMGSRGERETKKRLVSFTRVEDGEIEVDAEAET